MKEVKQKGKEGRQKRTFRKSTSHGLSALCLKHLLEFFLRDTSWFQRAADFCNEKLQ